MPRGKCTDPNKRGGGYRSWETRRADPTFQLLQVMPERRVRLNPIIIPQLAAWLLAVAEDWERQRLGLLAKDPDILDPATKNGIRWCEHAARAVDTLIRKMMETVSLNLIDRFRAEWVKGLPESQITPDIATRTALLERSLRRKAG